MIVYIINFDEKYSLVILEINYTDVHAYYLCPIDKLICLKRSVFGIIYKASSCKTIFLD